MADGRRGRRGSRCRPKGENTSTAGSGCTGGARACSRWDGKRRLSGYRKSSLWIPSWCRCSYIWKEGPTRIAAGKCTSLTTSDGTMICRVLVHPIERRAVFWYSSIGTGTRPDDGWSADLDSRHEVDCLATSFPCPLHILFTAHSVLLIHMIFTECSRTPAKKESVHVSRQSIWHGSASECDPLHPPSMPDHDTLSYGPTVYAVANSYSTGASIFGQSLSRHRPVLPLCPLLARRHDLFLQVNKCSQNVSRQPPPYTQVTVPPGTQFWHLLAASCPR